MGENGALIIKGILFLLLAGGGCYVGIRVKRAMSGVARTVKAVGELVGALEGQQELLAKTPRSVKGMTSVYLPQIEADFPSFNWPQFRQKCENTLKAYLRALDELNPGELADVSDALREQARLQIEDLKGRAEREHYREVKIHQTEISRYIKREGQCVIRVQSAVEYNHSVGEAPAKDKTQTRYDMELVYVQDVSKVKDGATAVGTVCPHCGAPVTNLGSKFCAYCKSALTPVDDRVWRLQRIGKDD